MSEVKPCPFHNCLTCGCYDSIDIPDKDWNTRPEEVIIYLGFDWTEINRYEKAKKAWLPYIVKSPCVNPLILIKKI